MAEVTNVYKTVNLSIRAELLPQLEVALTTAKAIAYVEAAFTRDPEQFGERVAYASNFHEMLNACQAAKADA
ncbi:hypothetical protein [Pseudoduganella aquatica]|uniref:hypothetical protein n=1 Tax=Pseudoduganella aquatica TaxID=2660641 RepID=UPI001E3D7E1E|nr:hypothetical protein [Pseudoduganella aquatica]